MTMNNDNKGNSSYELTTSNNTNTIACFLDLPSGSALSIDGISVSIQRNDFVGISQIPTQQLHFITITASNSSSLTTGFVLLQQNNESALIRQYDPCTEEVSATLVVDDMTTTHLLQQVPALEQQQRIVPYHLLVTTEQQTKWHQSLTNYIAKEIMQQRGIHVSGQKVVPGCLADGNTDSKLSTNQTPPPDGTSLSYFPVPILDQRRPRHRWRASRHVGTQRFLLTLSAQEKTQLFIDEHPSQRAWERLFAKQYQSNWEWVLGDVQLSFLCFIHLHCFESLVHWRDLLSLLGQLENPSRLLISVLMHQLSNLDASDVFQTSMDGDDDDDEEEEGENSIATALQRLVQTWKKQGLDSNNDEEALQHLSNLIQDRLCPRIQSVHNDDDDGDDDFDDNAKEVDHDSDGDDIDDDDGSEGPMIVDTDDYEAALQRNQQSNRAFSTSSIYYTPEIAKNYPILWAAKQDHEDLVMTCARALEEANDVSLVRQAADYLQQVEAKSVPF